MDGWDLQTAQWIAAHRHGLLTHVALDVMKAGMNQPFLGLCTIAFLTWAIIGRRYAMAVGTPVAGILAAGVTLVLKQVFERPRPPTDLALVHPLGYSMPSTNSALFAAVTVAVLLSIRPRGRLTSTALPGPAALAVPAVLAVAAVLANLFADACMIYLGAHWVSDVIAGWVVGIVTGLAVVLGCRRILPSGAREYHHHV